MKKYLFKFEFYILFTFTFFTIISIDFVGTKFLNYKQKVGSDKVLGKVLGSSNPIYHHGFIKNGTFESYYSTYTNSLGFKDSKVREVELNTNRKRIMFIGDSFTEGSMLDWEDTFVGIISDSLKNKNVEVLNAGRSSYSPSLYWRKLEYYISKKKLKIDELIVMIDMSDLEDELKYHNIYEDNQSGVWLDLSSSVINGRVVEGSLPSDFIHNSKWLNIKSYVAVFLQKNFFVSYNIFNFLNDQFFVLIGLDRSTPLLENNYRYYYGRDYLRSNWTIRSENNLKDQVNFGFSLMDKHMKKIVELCNKQNIKLSLGVYPWPGQIYLEDYNSIHVKHWEKFSKENSINFINLFPAIFNPEIKTKDQKYKIINNYYFNGDMHFNKNGNKLLAKHLLKFLKF